MSKTARQLAEEFDLDVEDMFEAFAQATNAKVIFSAHFKSLTKSAQNQLLKFCSDNNDTDAYNFYHSLI